MRERAFIDHFQIKGMWFEIQCFFKGNEKNVRILNAGLPVHSPERIHFETPDHEFFSLRDHADNAACRRLEELIRGEHSAIQSLPAAGSFMGDAS